MKREDLMSCADGRILREAAHHPNGLLAQHLMNERDRNRSFADSRGDSLDAARADVADGEDAGPARFEQQRRARERPAGGHEIVVRQIRTGLDETALVERETAIEPTGVRRGARHHEDVPDLMLLFVAGLRVAPPHGLELTV